MERWAELDRAVEAALDPRGEGGRIPEGTDIGSMMEEWLTQTDPKEKGTAQVILNRMHAQGCVLARMAHLALEVDERRVQDVVPGCEELEISEEAVDRMGWRELSQALDNVQLNWLRVACLPGARDLCWKLLARFGFFAGYAFAEGEDGVDAVHDREACVRPGGGSGHRLSDLAKVQALDAFFCLFRYLWLMGREVRAPDEERREGAGGETGGDGGGDAGQGGAESVPGLPGLQLRRFHFEAATDTYHGATMHDDVHCGAILQYMHRFAGLYHSVSQAVYFHKPTYGRRRAPLCLADLTAPGAGRTAIDWVPVLQQVYPELRLFHEAVDLRELPRDGWCWLHAPGRVWLVGPGMSVYWHPCPALLLALYVRRAAPGEPRRV